ncbi:hypothetical protein EH2_00853 [Bacillus subtilis]|nr:hypothetical protein EH2_00853 [Bacillus subtilis]
MIYLFSKHVLFCSFTNDKNIFESFLFQTLQMTTFFCFIVGLFPTM